VRAIQIEEFGGPEVLKLVELPLPEPSDGELLVRVTRCGVNFSDTHQRENVYLAKYGLPLIPGGEVAGVVERGSGGFEEGQRVLALTGEGGYADYVAAAPAATFAIPDGVDDDVAISLLVQGLTAWHLYRTCARLQPGDSVVITGASGGVGNLAVQLGRALEAGRVIALASSEDKRERALSLGADAALDPAVDDLAAAIEQANGGRKVDIVLEAAGGRVFDQCMAALADFGRMVTYGIASREQNQVKTGHLMRHSKSVIGFWLLNAQAREDMMREPLADLFDRAARGQLKPLVGETYPLSEARRAHEDLVGRRTSGKLLLDPER
jgi:NADPH2:quinone reductase